MLNTLDIKCLGKKLILHHCSCKNCLLCFNNNIGWIQYGLGTNASDEVTVYYIEKKTIGWVQLIGP